MFNDIDFSLLSVMWDEAPESKIQDFWGETVWAYIPEEDALVAEYRSEQSSVITEIIDQNPNPNRTESL